MREPRPSHLRPHPPSPLVQVHHLRPLSTGPDNAKADPNYLAEDVEKIPKSVTSSLGSSYGDNWLLQQQQEKRRCRRIGWSITLAVVLVITAAAVVGWYFTTVKKV